MWSNLRDDGLSESLDHLDCGSGTGQCLITLQASIEAYVVNVAKQNMIVMLLLLVFAYNDV